MNPQYDFVVMNRLENRLAPVLADASSVSGRTTALEAATSALENTQALVTVEYTDVTPHVTIPRLPVFRITGITDLADPQTGTICTNNSIITIVASRIPPATSYILLPLDGLYRFEISASDGTTNVSVVVDGAEPALATTTVLALDPNTDNVDFVLQTYLEAGSQITFSSTDTPVLVQVLIVLVAADEFIMPPT